MGIISGVLIAVANYIYMQFVSEWHWNRWESIKNVQPNNDQTMLWNDVVCLKWQVCSTCR